MQVSRTVHVPVEVAWASLAEDFPGIADWSGGVSDSRPLEASAVPADFAVDPDAPVAGRVVTVDGKEQSHVLVDFDAAERTYTFRADGLPPVIAYAHNVHRFEATADGSTELSVDVYLVPAGPAKLFKGALARKFEGYMEAYLLEAATHAETSRPVTAGL